MSHRLPVCREQFLGPVGDVGLFVVVARERLDGRSSVPRSLLLDVKRRAVDGAYQIAATGTDFEQWLLRSAAYYLSKGDGYLTETTILDNWPRAHALAAYGIAAGVIDAIPSVAAVVTE